MLTLALGAGEVSASHPPGALPLWKEPPPVPIELETE